MKVWGGGFFHDPSHKKALCGLVSYIFVSAKEMLSVCLSVCLALRLSVRLSLRLSVCLPITQQIAYSLFSHIRKSVIVIFKKYTSFVRNRKDP